MFSFCTDRPFSPRYLVPNTATGHRSVPGGSCFARLPIPTLLQEIEIRDPGSPIRFCVVSQVARLSRLSRLLSHRMSSMFVPPIAQFIAVAKSWKKLTYQYPAG